MIHFPIEFQASSKASQGMQTPWKGGSPNLPEITLAIPKEFEGPGNGYSPEDLYALALENCFIATFKVMAERSRLEFESIIVEVTLTVDRNEKKVPWMAKTDFKVTLTGASNPDKASRLLAKTETSCFVLNSVKTEKIFHYEIK